MQETDRRKSRFRLQALRWPWVGNFLVGFAYCSGNCKYHDGAWRGFCCNCVHFTIRMVRAMTLIPEDWDKTLIVVCQVWYYSWFICSSRAGKRKFSFWGFLFLKIHASGRLCRLNEWKSFEKMGRSYLYEEYNNMQHIDSNCMDIPCTWGRCMFTNVVMARGSLQAVLFITFHYAVRVGKCN